MAANIPTNAPVHGTPTVPHIEHDEHLHHDEHHEQSFLTKYIFSQDHKVIAKQFLITGIFWAILGGALSSLFRIQLGWPESTMSWLTPVLGKWVEAG
jgi:cytochrome c oxidase subunit 1